MTATASGFRSTSALNRSSVSTPGASPEVPRASRILFVLAIVEQRDGAEIAARILEAARQEPHEDPRQRVALRGAELSSGEIEMEGQIAGGVEVVGL